MKKTVFMLISLTAAFLRANVTVVKNIAYYPPSSLEQAGTYQKERCKLDLRYPKNTANFSTLVFFHGGGLESGNKHFLKIDPSIAQATVNYRFLQKDRSVTGDTCIEDAAAAIAWTLKNIASYGGDPQKVFVGGVSAGGYLTMMACMDPSRLAKWGFSSKNLAGLIPISGQATKHFNVRKYAGDTDEMYLPKIDRLAPLSFCSADLPPILSVCGQSPWEWKARNEENRFLIASCTAMGHPAAYFVEMPFCDHARVGSAARPYVEFFIKNRMPPHLIMPTR